MLTIEIENEYKHIKLTIMKRSVFFLIIALSMNVNAFNYTITFTGSGASNSVGDVIVQNLTQGTSVTVPAGNVLNLTDVTAINEPRAIDELIRIYPSYVNGKSIVSFFAKQGGVTQINAFSMDGRKLVGKSISLPAGENSFQLSLSKGAYILQVVGNGYAYSTRLISQSSAQNYPMIEYSGNKPVRFTAPQKSKSEVSSVTSMIYTVGDQLLYTAVSGNYSTIVTDKPTQDKTTNFNFVVCVDPDGNNYKTVTIGTQIWMAENLKTTHYRNGNAIANVTDNTAWGSLSTGAWCDYSNLAYNGTKYGHLYNWYAAADSRSIAPMGWHVPTDAEWTTLTNYVSTNFGTSLTLAKALAANTDWTPYTTSGTIGCNLTLNNSTGFSALPCGYGSGTFFSLGDYSYWWTATKYSATAAWGCYLGYRSVIVGRIYNGEALGYCVRCVRD